MKHLAALLLLLVVGCSRAVTPPLSIKVAHEVPPIRTIAVVPASASPAMGGDGAAQAPPVLSRLLAEAVAREGSWKIAAAERVKSVLGALPADSPETRAGAVAKRVGADAAITATVIEFRERQGSDYGVSEPASVALQVLLVPAGAQQAAWRADYSYTQEPLAYNLWNFWGVLRGGAKWLTAEEIAQIGVEEAVRRLAALAPTTSTAKPKP